MGFWVLVLHKLRFLVARWMAAASSAWKSRNQKIEVPVKLPWPSSRTWVKTCGWPRWFWGWQNHEQKESRGKIAWKCYARWLTLQEFDLNHFFMQGKSYRNIEHIKQSSKKTNWQSTKSIQDWKHIIWHQVVKFQSPNPRCWMMLNVVRIPRSKPNVGKKTWNLHDLEIIISKSAKLSHFEYLRIVLLDTQTRFESDTQFSSISESWSSIWKSWFIC